MMKLGSCIWKQRIKNREKGRNEMREIDVFIDTEEIAEFFYQELIKRGFIPAEDEVRELADITFEYLLKKDIIAEESDD